MKLDQSTPTKQKILNILKKMNRATVKELMDYFTISEIAVRKHLGELEHQEFIRKKTKRQEIGRPYFTYELTEKGHSTFPNHYEELPLEILKDLESVQGKEAVKAVFTKRMEREKNFFLSKLDSTNFHKRMLKFVQMQNNNGFIIEYKQLSNGDYELINYNCPILNIASSYNQLCKNEQEVLSEIFPKSNVKQKSSIASDKHYCRWVITSPTE